MGGVEQKIVVNNEESEYDKKQEDWV